MDLRQLRYFVAVAEELHFGRAAARLHMSQPPLSQRIRELEAELECRVLERSPRGVQLTAAGCVLLAEARELLARADRVKERVRSVTGRRTLIIGVVSGVVASAGLDIGASVRSALRGRYPDVTVRLHEGRITEPTAGLRAGQCDIAVTRLPFDTTGITTRSLYTEPLVAALRADDPLATRATVDLRDLRDRTWYRLPENSDPDWARYWTGGDPACAAARTASTTDPTITSIDECLHAVLWENATGLLPAGAKVRHATPGVAFVPVTGYPASRVVVAWLPERADQLVLDLVDATVTCRTVERREREEPPGSRS